MMTLLDVKIMSKSKTIHSFRYFITYKFKPTTAETRPGGA